MQFKITAALTLLSASSALAAVSLGDISPLQSSEVVKGCYDAYNAQINGCTKEMFTTQKCSSDCQKDLETHSNNVMLACRQAFAGPDTLLRKIMDGGLVVTLCGTGKESDDKASSSVKSGASSTVARGSVTAQATGSATVTGATTLVSVTGTATSSGVTPSGTAGGNGTTGGNDGSGAGQVAVKGLGVVVAAVVVGFAAVF